MLQWHQSTLGYNHLGVDGTRYFKILTLPRRGVWPTAPTCNGDLKVKFGHRHPRSPVSGATSRKLYVCLFVDNKYRYSDRNQSMGTQKCSLDILTEIIRFCEIKRKTSISVKHTLDSGCTDFSRVLKTWNRENGDIEKNGDPKTEKGPQWQWQWTPNSDQFSKKKVINFSP